MAKRQRPVKVKPPEICIHSRVVKENLPYPYVHYPNHYGTFFSFSLDESSTPVMCACSRPAVENFLRLKQLYQDQPNANPLREAPLDSFYFSDEFAQLSLIHRENSISQISFEKGLCHRCNLITPSLRYCHEMYGGQFVQQYGWYINQTYLRLGIHRYGGYYLADQCPIEFQDLFKEISIVRGTYQVESQKINNLVFGPKRTDIKDDEVTYCHNVKFDEAKPYVDVQKALNKLNTRLKNKVEDITRQEFGFRKVGEGWVSETILYQIVCKIFDGKEISRHYRPDWLEGLELDIFIDSFKIGLEYQGQQHYHPIKAWGGEKALQELRARDSKKLQICSKKGIQLITIDYTEPLTEDYIRKKLNGLL